ncbi:helix-turn-helix transcriptional regulator [Sphingosinicella sp.]|uniref:helix-turn-helix transcriptional regulator n=1 Tax=Sphingosinicella sp. TaxID=1917971 RepID=UPI0035B01441
MDMTGEGTSVGDGELIDSHNIVSAWEGLVGAAATSVSRLLSAVDTPNGLNILDRELQALCPYTNFIVYVFELGTEPQVLYSNHGVIEMRHSMADYIRGLYTLDPFYQVTTQKGCGLYRMRDIMPEAFPKSEYYRRFYKFTNVIDEFRYIVMPDERRSVHIFVEREGGGNEFSPRDSAVLKLLEPAVSAYVKTHFRLLTQPSGSQASATAQFDLRAQVMAMESGVLTPREVDTVELMLKGHSVKSMATLLNIDNGTVANHKRHVYAKLKVHSQAQLFNRFLRSLSD